MRNYNGAQVTIAIAGIPCSGFGDDEFISVERDEDSFTKKAGVDGEVSRSKSNNKMGTATLTLMQTSATNQLLSTLHTLDELSGDGVGPFLVKDLSGSSIYSGQNCWVRKPPAGTFAREAGVRVWLVDIDKLIINEGGN